MSTTTPKKRKANTYKRIVKRQLNRITADIVNNLPSNFTMFSDTTIDEIIATTKNKIKERIDCYGNIPHETVSLLYHGNQVNIDKAIAPLLTEILKARIDTYNSCENNNPKGYIWIQFASCTDFEQFMIICFYIENPKRNEAGDQVVIEKENIFENAFDHENPLLKEKWIITTNLDQDFYQETGKVDISTSVRFPKEHLEYIYQKFLNYNKEVQSL